MCIRDRILTFVVVAVVILSCKTTAYIDRRFVLTIGRELLRSIKLQCCTMHDGCGLERVIMMAGLVRESRQDGQISTAAPKRGATGWINSEPLASLFAAGVPPDQFPRNILATSPCEDVANMSRGNRACRTRMLATCPQQVVSK